MTIKDKSPSIERLLDVLNAYGADPEKWPLAERAGLEKLLNQQRDSNAALSHELAAAGSLDRLLLDQTTSIKPTMSSDIASLSKGIMARIADEKLQNEKNNSDSIDQNAPSAVIDLEQFKTDRTKSILPPKPHWQDRSTWRTAALLAATFLFGIYIGATLISEPAVEGVAALANSNNSNTVEFTLFQGQPNELFGEEM